MDNPKRDTRGVSAGAGERMRTRRLVPQDGHLFGLPLSHSEFLKLGGTVSRSETVYQDNGSDECHGVLRKFAELCSPPGLGKGKAAGISGKTR